MAERERAEANLGGPLIGGPAVTRDMDDLPDYEPPIQDVADYQVALYCLARAMESRVEARNSTDPTLVEAANAFAACYEWRARNIGGGVHWIDSDRQAIVDEVLRHGCGELRTKAVASAIASESSSPYLADWFDAQARAFEYRAATNASEYPASA